MKESLRIHFRKVRSALSKERRQSAFKASLQLLDRLAATHTRVLSYASFDSEFDTWSFNHLLAAEGKLCLPKMIGETLRVFHVNDLTTELKTNRCGILEPITSLCKEIQPEELTLLLVPGLAFDPNNQRLGYGRGYYDRFLKKLSPKAFTCGIGFHEQRLTEPLPISPVDVSLTAIHTF